MKKYNLQGSDLYETLDDVNVFLKSVSLRDKLNSAVYYIISKLDESDFEIYNHNNGKKYIVEDGYEIQNEIIDLNFNLNRNFIDIYDYEDELEKIYENHVVEIENDDDEDGINNIAHD